MPENGGPVTFPFGLAYLLREVINSRTNRLKVNRGLHVLVAVILVLSGATSNTFGALVREEAVQAKLSLAAKCIKGKVHRPFSMDKSAKASILFFITHDCPIANKYSREIQRIMAEYETRKMKSFLVYVDPEMNRNDVVKHMKDFGYGSQTAFLDLRHELVRATGAKVTPEAVVVTGRGVIAYRGRIDNLYEDLGVGRKQVTKRELREALDAIATGQKVPISRTTAVGCFIPVLK